MKRRDFLARAAALPLILRTTAAETTHIESLRESAPTTSTDEVKAASNTPIASRYHLTRDRVLYGDAPAYQPDFILEDVSGTGARRFTNFSGDVSGRWIGALSTAAVVYGEKFLQLDEVVRRTIVLQHPDGYFGKQFHYDKPDDDDLALLWGNGRLLVGLMEYYGLTHDAATLASARKLGDFLVHLGPKYNSKKMSDEFGAL